MTPTRHGRRSRTGSWPFARTERTRRSAPLGRVDGGRVPRRALSLLLTALLVVLAGSGCQDGEVSSTQVCQSQCDYRDANAFLSRRDVVQVIANALFEAQANGITDVTVVVNDHLNNVLAVFDSDASTTDFTRISSLGDPNRTVDTPFRVEANGNSADFVGSGLAATSGIDALNTALDGVFIPNGYAAMSKAGTANYFSTQGNAFSSRTASVLIQQNFYPGETDRPGGPLFAVQIAQLVCSDINTRQNLAYDVTGFPIGQTIGACNAAGDAGCPDPLTPGANDLLGPRRLPVGFAADPGGLPLYKDGIPELPNQAAIVTYNPAAATGRTGKVVVGAVGIEFNGVYGVDKNALGADRNLEERIAVGATRGFEADIERQATRISVAGKALRFADDTGLRSDAGSRPIITALDVGSPAAILAALDAISGRTGRFVFDEFYFPFTTARAGVQFLDPASGVEPFLFLPTGGGALSLPAAGAQGERLVDGNGAPRYPAIDSVNPAPAPAFPTPPGIGQGLSADEVQELLVSALLLAENTRAQTRTPLGGQARIDVAVVDLDGNVLGFARSIDALLDGVDVTIAKTRQAAFWSKANAQAQLLAAADPLGNTPDPMNPGQNLLNAQSFTDYVNLSADFLSIARPAATTQPPFNGDIAWSSISLGGIANPDFPPGVASGPNGPLSRDPDIGEWSIFSTGIQTEVVLPSIAVGLCDEVPDLAGVLFDLGFGTPPGGGRAALFAADPAGAATRDTFCDSVRTALIANPDPAFQTDCLVGTQNPAPPGLPNITGLQNGFHIFQGAVPIYRRNSDGTSTLIGAYGVSGDGAEQDDFVPFVSLDEVFKSQVGRGVANPIGNAPRLIRADNVSVSNVNLRYVVCPPAPFLSSNEQNGCQGR